MMTLQPSNEQKGFIALPVTFGQIYGAWEAWYRPQRQLATANIEHGRATGGGCLRGRMSVPFVVV